MGPEIIYTSRIFGTGTGMGRLVIESQQRLDAAGAWALLLIVGVVGYLTNSTLAGLPAGAFASSPATNLGARTYPRGPGSL